MIGEIQCPVCNSKFTAYLQDVIGRRTRNLYRQYFCMDCRSCFHRSGYKEDDSRLRLDYEYLLNMRDIHAPLSSQLMLEVKSRFTYLKTMCEVGHGLGMLMKAGVDYGLDVTGFEINPLLHDFVKNELKLPSHLGYFDESHPKKYDLIASLHVFEHLENPRELFRCMVNHLNDEGVILMSVPFFERNQWQYLHTAGHNPAPSPPDNFYDNDVHICHFSIDGMKSMGLSLGASAADYYVSKDVVHKSVGSYQYILFSFRGSAHSGKDDVALRIANKRS
jgi:2-polyprenyl-3-methyl-5-hydroxy-6-metoxy-1,4-benzoquinol methylase